VKFSTIVLQVNMHRLTESDFRFDTTLSRWQRKVLSPGKCTCRVCPVDMQQRPPVLDL